MSVHWYLGRALCDMWVSMDVLCCTASILHLVAIAVDRYWAVSNIDYVRRRCARQILLMIGVVWLVSVAISIPPLFGWRHDSDNPELSGVCMISQDHGYTIFSTVGAFYCPLVLMLVLNFKIYRAARYRIRRKGFMQGARARAHVPVPAVHVEQETTAQATRKDSDSDVSNEGVSVFHASCVLNQGDTTGAESSNTGYYGGESTSDSNPNDSYFPVSTVDPDHHDPLPTLPSFDVSAASSESSSSPDEAERLCVESRSSSPIRSRSSSSSFRLTSGHRTLSSGHLTGSGSGSGRGPVTVHDRHRLSIPSPHQPPAPSPHLLTVPDPHYLQVPSPHLLTVPDPHLLRVPSPHHLTVPDPHLLQVPTPHHLAVPDPHHLRVSSCSLLTVPEPHHIPTPTARPPQPPPSPHPRLDSPSASSVLALDSPDGPEPTEPVLAVSVPDVLHVPESDPQQVTETGPPRVSIPSAMRRKSSVRDPLNLDDKRHLAVPESSNIEVPEHEGESVAPADSKLVQFNTRVKVEGDTDASETSNSLKPGEDESLPPEPHDRETDTDTSQDRRDSDEDDDVVATICCSNVKILNIELSCLPSVQRQKNSSSSSNNSSDPQQGGSYDVSSSNPRGATTTMLEMPVVTIRKDSCSQYMSESRCLTPAFHSSSSPSTTTTNTSGTSSSQGQQLTVPQIVTVPPTPQPRRFRGGGGNNNTKRARNREKEKQRREKLEMRRERKAARVLGIITGAFVLCWLPFFILALLGPFLPLAFRVPDVLVSLFLWLGYFNSLLNPIIYTVFNPSFRSAFRKIFFKRLRSVTRS